MKTEEKIPNVFISYSHDTPAHKRWVADIASKLLNNGVNVLLDQWELSLGDDLIKFMEHSLTNADRVLMICSEPYVKKADEGKGGVGYEAMIVTGELVRDLGTSKFIPIIRQESKDIILPKSMSTRYYVNLSEGQDFGKQFDQLLRELHQIPTGSKPPLGKNPFAKKPSGEEIPIDNNNFSLDIPNISKIDKDISGIYKIALNIARKGDIVAWRKIIRQAKQLIPAKINEWRKIQDSNPPKKNEDLSAIVLSGIAPYAPLFTIALAGVESGREKFNNQIAILDEVYNPRDWNYAGLTILGDFPDTSAYIYHCLHGAICLGTDQIDIAIKFALSKTKTKYDSEYLPVISDHKLTGWPSTLGGDCKIAWNFIRVLPEKWTWLNKLFGDLYEYQIYLCAYYLLLNILEFVTYITAGKEKILVEKQKIALDVPLSFFREQEEVLQKSYQLLLNDSTQLKNVWRNFNIEDSKVKELWPRWIFHMRQWLNEVHMYGYSRHIIHKNLFKDLV